MAEQPFNFLEGDGLVFRHDFQDAFAGGFGFPRLLHGDLAFLGWQAVRPPVYCGGVGGFNQTVFDGGAKRGDDE